MAKMNKHLKLKYGSNIFCKKEDLKLLTADMPTYEFGTKKNYKDENKKPEIVEYCTCEIEDYVVKDMKCYLNYEFQEIVCKK